MTRDMVYIQLVSERHLAEKWLSDEGVVSGRHLEIGKKRLLRVWEAVNRV